MWLKAITIKNFRTIENLHIDFDKRCNVIVGPNAIGKTTLLEAIRLTKATLAPRTVNETQQAFITLGALTPHNPTQVNTTAIAREHLQSILIDTTFELHDVELQSLDANVEKFAVGLVRSTIGNSIAQGPLGLVQHLSSPSGLQQLADARSTILKELPGIKLRKHLKLNLVIDPISGVINGTNQIDQTIFGVLESNLPAHQALFSYFPADRALPVGDVNIQLGGQDIAAQLESHNSQPHTKYHRLKSTIVSNYVLSKDNQEQLTKDFEEIFSNVLKNRGLVGISINEFGLVSIQIEDTETHRKFDIDGMSSGEKGLILTFLLISQSVHRGGIVAIDEPELHLNPAVCKTILPFLIAEYLIPHDLQAIICSHSPDILGAAFESDDCTLLHLQSPTVISKIYAADRSEVFDALKRLGTSTSDVLFSAGNIFVEGPDDIDVLQAGFDELVNKYKITQLGGRTSIEKEIRTIQSAEKKGMVDTIKCFVFDLDKAPTDFQSTKYVKILQWKRYCLENYLINEKIIYDLLNDKEISSDRIDKRGEVIHQFKELAIGQLKEVVAQQVYDAMNYDNPGLRPKEVQNKTYPDMSDILFARLALLQSQVGSLVEMDWKKEFIERCEAEHAVKVSQWDVDWADLCDGKRFFRDLQSKFSIRTSPIKFKKMIAERMRNEKVDAWVLVNQLLSDALKVV